MQNAELAPYFYGQIPKILSMAEEQEEQKIIALYEWMNRLFLQCTKNENIHFTTLNARIAFVCHRERIPAEIEYYVQLMRRLGADILYKKKEPKKIDLARMVLSYALAIEAVLKEKPAEKVAELLEYDALDGVTPLRNVVETIQSIRVLCVSIDLNNQFLMCRCDDFIGQTIKVKYAQPAVNDAFDNSIKLLIQHWKGIATLQLSEVNIDNEGIWYPRVIILEPDYLIDVSAVAECFSAIGAEPIGYVVKKFMPFENTIPLVTGNIANFLLDELMNDHEVEFAPTFPKVFQLNPLTFAHFTDEQVREVYTNAKRHFQHLRHTILEELPEKKIQPEHCSLEPSFYSEKYGLQGRLDVFYNDPNSERAAIIELKSGKPFQANRFGLSPSHYVQTLLYDLLIRSTFGKDANPDTYILYSTLELNALRYAPPFASQQMEALQVRNNLAALEQALCNLDAEGLDKPCLLDRLLPEYYPGLTGFGRKDMESFGAAYGSASALEKKYFRAFTAFIAREHRLAKTGEQGNDRNNGLANIWLQDFQEKVKNFEIVSHLRLSEDHSGEEEPILIFEKTENTNALANFREGDIAVLYPLFNASEEALRHRIFKCNILKITPKNIVIRLRSKQFNHEIFRADVFWNIEHDMFDSSFSAQYKALFSFLKSRPQEKNKLLTLTPPNRYERLDLKFSSDVNEEQKSILEKALSSPDYFLLMGPPGTGKTKFMLRNFTKYILENTQENLLLLAYTNRAVDEICDAIHDFAESEYLRIGSSTSCEERFQDNLLSVCLKKINTRKELNHLLGSRRIFISTVSSMQNHAELLEFKSFERVVIDEASQIPEPMLIGLLPLFKRFILIGDHKQLPAVVIQSPDKTGVKDEDLLKIGLTDRRNSLFERLMNRAASENWDWCYDMLSVQGRMHEDIMAFPNQFFYNRKLKTLPSELEPSQWQNEPLKWSLPDDYPTNDFLSKDRFLELSKKLFEKRFQYADVPIDIHDGYKTNLHEANLCVELVLSFYHIYKHNGMAWAGNTLGIITPYRAQIAQIKQLLNQIPDFPVDTVTIDTVERYQGGARDIILLSLCINAPFQLETLVSQTNDGVVDRKLNVALTRARQHLFVMGNKNILKANGIYEKLIVNG